LIKRLKPSKMIEAQTPNATEMTTTETTTMETPQTITTTMILADLENGIDRPGIKTKYNLESWELTEMFKHPVLKGKKASRKRKMSFTFVDDTPAAVVPATVSQTDLEEVIEEVETETYNDDQTMAMEQELEDRKQAESDFSDGFDA
tara:strand:+ start:2626 stop:3066 length:441 start_codon:yes stop_codon:yes gene_type:complete